MNLIGITVSKNYAKELSICINKNYMHFSKWYIITQQDDKETIDLRVLREAENKARQMGEVEYILKTNSVDCNLNLNGNNIMMNVMNYLMIETTR